MHKRVAGIHDVDAFLALSTQVAGLTKTLESFGINSLQSPFVSCELCGDNHATHSYPSLTKLVQFVGAMKLDDRKMARNRLTGSKGNGIAKHFSLKGDGQDKVKMSFDPHFSLLWGDLSRQKP
ncbi:Uncharacterized protein TCM_033045 [Theobroma cacao]|uniref:Uncharacterized protein n=1 Tax=Theobroma cacao TaxID=3641 RepID=A0A061FBA5_THECC|nr:Uncharacterized protein TCM_033045 [Theobroma cacao]